MSKERLQEGLNKLASYYKRWSLEVNLDKSKVIVFSRTGRTPHNVSSKYDNSKYFGTVISAFGSFSHAKEEFIDREINIVFIFEKFCKKTDFDGKLSRTCLTQ